MTRSSVRRRALWLLLAGSLSVLLEAQTSQSEPLAESRLGPQDFGIADTQTLIIGYSEFVPPATSGATTSSSAATGTKWIVSSTPPLAVLAAGLNGRIPNGARITRMCLFGLDTDGAAGNELSLYLFRNFADALDGADPTGLVASSISSSGAPGNFMACSGPLNVLVDNHWDIDGDGTDEFVDYNLQLGFGDNEDFSGSAIRVRFVRIDWRRQVSPAPAFASFADVPTNHPFHQFVEALYAAGITAGCGGGNYCVNNPITRGEMAVFLAAALGLHWPGF